MRFIVKQRFIIAICLLASVNVAHIVAQQSPTRRTSVAVLNTNGTSTGQRVVDKLAVALSADADLALADRDESRAAASGAGYAGSLNLTLSEAHDLGLALGADFYLLCDAQVQRRSPSDRPAYFEAYASVFLVSTRTGRLVTWERPSFAASSPEAAEKLLFAEAPVLAARYRDALRAAEMQERNERAQALEHRAPLIADVPEEGSAAAAGWRLPAPYRRLQPAYPETAARADAEGIVDVQVSLDEGGEVISTEIARWAGFGLDEATVNTIRQLHFRPAQRDGVAVPMRVLLRYNFRRPTEKK